MKSKLLLTLVLVIELVSAGRGWAAGAEPDSDSLLKPDTPKLDTSNAPKGPLKGGVQHNATALPDKPKNLNGRAQDGGDNLKGKVGGNGISNLFKRRPKIDKEKLDQLNLDATAGIGIIGIKFMMGFGHPPTVNHVFPGTPAYEKGIRPNDIIVAVDGVPTYGLTKDEVYSMIIGTPNTSVTLSLRRDSDFTTARMMRMDFNDIKDPKVRREYQNM